MLKEGPYQEIETEVAHNKLLGSIAPNVYHTGRCEFNSDQGFIVMEYLPLRVEHDLLCRGMETLEDHVWVRSNPYPFDHREWRKRFLQRFSFNVPQWIDEEPCLTHGDPTLANMRWNGRLMRFIDPWPAGNGIPPYPSVDRGKVMQSFLGWEQALYYMAGSPNEHKEDFLYNGYVQFNPFHGMNENTLRRTMFWCMMHFIRIVYRESTYNNRVTALGKWASLVAIEIGKVLGLENEARLGLGWDHR